MKQYPADTITDTDRSPENVLLPSRRATLTTTMSSKAVHSTEFYASQSKAETLRLDLMAQPTGIISLQALGNTQDATIVDFGAGNSSWLGQQIEEGGARYIGLDTRPDAVESLATAGLESHILESDGRANNLPPHCADKIHARFVLSWLDPGARKEALEEMFRLVKADGQLVIIDYNWDAIQGPPELMTAVKTTIGIMQDFGFDPQYGTKLDTDIPRTIKNITGELGGDVSYHSPHAEPPFEGTLRDALDIIRQTAESVKSGLMRAEKYADIARVETALAGLETYAAGHPDAPVRLADMVVQTIDVTMLPDERQVMAPPKIVPFGEGDYTVLGQLPRHRGEIVSAESDSAIANLRELQGYAYTKSGLVDKPERQGKWALSEEIDPPGQVDRSRYFTAIDQNGRPHSCIRYITSDPSGGARSLRAFDSLDEVTQIGLLQQYEDEDIIEISAFAKDYQAGNLLDVAVAVIGAALEAKQRGYKCALMELRKAQQANIEHVFGTDNFTVLCDSVTIAQDGVNGDEEYVILRADPDTFLPTMLENVEAKLAANPRPGARRSGFFATLHQVLETHMRQ